MKKVIIYLFSVIAAFLFINCSNGSSGTAMLNLDVRIMPDETTKEHLENEVLFNTSRWKWEKKCYDDFSTLFTVLPGPYEFTWQELKNLDGAAGHEQCATKLKIRLRLNKTFKPVFNSRYGYTEEALLKALGLGSIYSFEAFNAEGKTSGEDSKNILLYLQPDLGYSTKDDASDLIQDNEDGIRDFYHFLTSKPGTEFDLIIDCGVHPCKDIEDIIEYNKGINFMIEYRTIVEYYPYK